MRRKSDRGKTKQTPKEQSPEKVTKKQRHSRRRRKSSSSSDSDNKSSKKEVAESSISKPLEIQVQDIELPQGENPIVLPPNDESKTNAENPQSEWKEDKSFWENAENDAAKGEEPNTSNADNDENSLWKVQSANGAGGEIQKLKICRQKPTESPELGETSLRKRLNRGSKGDGRSTDDSAHEESEKESKKSKHRNRTSSRNSPLVSPTVVCDMSGDSPTKIKIINVSHLNSDGKGGSVTKTENKDDVSDDMKKCDDTEENTMTSDTLDIALPSQPLTPVETDGGVPQKTEEIPSLPDIPKPITESDAPANISTDLSEEPFKGFNSDEKPSDATVEDRSVTSPKKPASPSLSLKKDDAHSTNKSSEDSDSSEYKTKRTEVQSTVHRKPASPKKSSGSEEEDKKKEVQRQDSSDTQDIKDVVNNKENEAVNSIPNKESTEEDNNTTGEKCPMPRKRRWGSSKSNRSNKRPILNISTASLKNLLPDAKPVAADELQLSVEEEEEGQLDDDEEEDEVVAFVTKEEEKQLEKERLKEEKQKEKEKELQDKKKRKERFEKNKPEQPVLKTPTDKGTPSRKILLLSDDAKKLARSPSPPRHKPTSVLFITHLVRPFTVQQLKNLLLRTGTITENGFWIDKIKSKCYVEYATEDQAVETRHALHGVRWPISNPKTLMVEFASHDDLIMAQALADEPEVPPKKAEPLNMVEGWVQDQARIKERNRRTVVREWDVGKPEHPDEALELELKMKEKRELEKKARKERHHRSDTPDAEPPARKSRRKDEDAPAKLLDDLFQKTKTSPCIYWLPLTQEQIAVKEEIRRQHMAEHERRMAELKKVDLARRDRERRTRK